VKTTLNIDDDPLQRARELTGLEGKTALVREGLKALIERERARCLAKHGGTERGTKIIPR